jgi:hypothetical protein
MIHARKDYERLQDPAGSIPEDELRAQDKVGPDAVEQWATLADLAGADPRITEHAREHAQRMRDYQQSHGAKIPDMPEGA